MDARERGVTGVLPAVSAVLEQGRREGVAPALSAAVLRGGALVHASWHGELPAPQPRPLRRDDLFDVASLTKVLATTTLAAQLADEGTLRLDAPVAERLRGFEQAGKERVTARHLLAHTSGLAWWRPYFERARADPVARAAFLPPRERPPPSALGDAFGRGRELLRAAVLAEPLETTPGARAVYSDPGFLAFGFLLEELLGEPLVRAAERRVFARLGLGATRYLDASGAPGQDGGPGGGAPGIAPTGWSEPRGETVQGAVNDDNAWMMGGGAPHAGVFSTAGDVAALGQAWLDALRGNPSAVLPPSAAAELARRDPTPGSTRALGWDTRSAEGSSLGGMLGLGPKGALGHLGFTGTSLWIDRDAEVVVALLTNRVHPSRDNERIRAFRPRFHDVVAESLGVRRKGRA
jgi:serine-type D-Ala-D-Ala carboxypeptidase